jgi:hypothetical protein
MTRINPDPPPSRSIALRYTVPAIGLLLVVPAILKGSFAFIRTFTHTLSSAIFTLELMVLAFGIGVGCLWWWQQQQAQPYYSVMQVMLEQLIREQSQPFTALEFAQRVKLPIAVVKPYLTRAVRQIQGIVEVTDRGEVYYSVSSPSTTSPSPSTSPSTSRSQTPTSQIASTETSLEAVTDSQRDTSLETLADVPNLESELKSELESELESNSDSSLEQVEAQLFDRWDREPSVETSIPNSIPNSITESPLSNTEAIAPLTQAQLARRLNVSASTIGYHKLKPDFADWVRSKDPEGLIWLYSTETKQFYLSIPNP